VLAGNVYEFTLFQVTDTLGFTLRTDAAGMVFACVSSFLYIPVSFYAIGYMRGHHEKEQTGFFASFAVCLSAAIGIALSANLLTFFIFYELLTIATWPLVFHERNEEARFSGRKYLVYTLVTGQLMLAGIVAIYVMAGTLEFQAGGFLTADMAPTWVLQMLFFLMVLGGAVKAGVMPLHGWLPSAMVAPTPVSALLHAVAVVKAGAFCVLRLIGFVFGPQLLAEIGCADVLAWVAAFTIIASSLIAMQQDNLKRRLAFSTVGQLSYVVLGAALLAPLSILGAYFHIVAHALMKITLFMCAGAIIVTAHKDNISDMHGIGKKMPITMACFTIASLGIAGMPFIIGFLSKWNLALGALQVGQPLFIAVLIASALLGLSYLMPVAYLAFFKPNDKGEFKTYGEANKFMLIPICVTAALSVILGIVPNFGPHLYDLASMAAQSITQGWIGGGW
ncbi:MAG: monovalent cation/H+ antiporter subunit D family protein, partial [Peptococcaceae bacterium]|nr:monovalent cation/H+ antiporter subunit D family protein [Peptococcaceae bacterium]